MDLTVTIVRHGNTFEPGEAPRRIGSRTDLPLVASGRAQADTLGRALRGFDRALVAPLQRTRATAEAILLGQPDAPAIEEVDWLSEIDHGPDEGATEDAVLARLGHDALAAWDADARVPDGWIVDSARRLEGWRNLLAHGEGRVLIVTSNGAARFALRADESLWRQATALPSLKLRTGAYGVIVRDPDGVRLVDWDRRP